MNKGLIPLDEAVAHCLSVNDDMGHVFRWQGRLMREIPSVRVDAFRRFWQSGLLQELMNARLVPETRQTDLQTGRGGVVLEHEQVSVVTYPCEWTFVMLRTAAELVLEVNERARQYGYELKDAHGYNVVFDGGRPLFVDLGSFAPISAGACGWSAEEEFRQFYLHPLRLWSAAGPHVARRLLTGGCSVGDYPAFRLGRRLGGILPRALVQSVLRLRRKIWLAGVLPDEDLAVRLGGATSRALGAWRRLRLPPMRGCPERRLRRTLARLSPWREQTMWTSYHRPLREEGHSARILAIMERVRALSPQRVMDIGCNEGEVAFRLREFASAGEVVAVDADPNAVEVLFLRTQGRSMGVTPALCDVMAPLRPAWGEEQEDRFRSDVVMALAISHHLLLTQRQPVDRMLRRLTSFSRGHLFVEFMPMGLWNGHTAPPVPGWYTREWFHAAFSRHCHDVQVEQLEENRVLFHGRVPEASGRA